MSSPNRISIKSLVDTPSSRKSLQRINTPKPETYYFPIRKSYILGPSLQETLKIMSSRIPRNSYALPKGYKKLERCWNPRFNVKFSKDNGNFHSGLREYFDVRKNFDTEPSRLKKSGSRANTNPSTPTSRKTPSKKRKIAFAEGRDWNDAYLPMSEFNVIKHKSKRVYFANFCKPIK